MGFSCLSSLYPRFIFCPALLCTSGGSEDCSITRLSCRQIFASGGNQEIRAWKEKSEYFFPLFLCQAVVLVVAVFFYPGPEFLLDNPSWPSGTLFYPLFKSSQDISFPSWSAVTLRPLEITSFTLPANTSNITPLLYPLQSIPMSTLCPLRSYRIPQAGCIRKES